MSLFAELKRRKVFRTLIAYGVAAWLIAQVAALLAQTFAAPGWVMRLVVVLLVIGIVPTIALAWAYDLTDEGIRRNAETGAGDRTRRLNVAIALLFTVAAVLLAYRWVGPDEGVTLPRVIEAGPPRVAILPFTSIAIDDEESALFADGVHQDLMVRMARLSQVRVLARSALTGYIDSAKTTREIADELQVDIVVTGSVRRAEDQIRISAAIVDVSAEETVWAEQFDRSLSTGSLFDVQSDIAEAITNALRLGTSETPDWHADVVPTENLAAYRAFHSALQVREKSRRSVRDPKYGELLEAAIAADPDYQRAKAELIGYLALQGRGSDGESQVPRIEQLLSTMADDTDAPADYLIAQTYYVYYVLRDYARAGRLVDQALALLPGDVPLLELKSFIQRRQGEFDRRIETLKRLVELSPRSERAHRNHVFAYLATHQYDAAKNAADAAVLDAETSEYLNALWQLQEAGDLEAFAAGRVAHYREHQSLRDLRPAIESLSAIDANDQIDALIADYAALDDPQFDRAAGYYQRTSAAWLTGDASLPTLIARYQEMLSRQRLPDGGFRLPRVHVFYARSLAMAGERDAAVREIAIWQRAAREDLADKVNYLDAACQALGIAGAAEEAVACLRDAFSAPSYAMPFLEVHLGFYDPIRESAPFQALVAAL
ncbi:MAG: hypothetical protein AAAFM81_14375 [Pseudomonadota bacterium]